MGVLFQNVTAKYRPLTSDTFLPIIFQTENLLILSIYGHPVEPDESHEENNRFLPRQKHRKINIFRTFYIRNDCKKISSGNFQRFRVTLKSKTRALSMNIVFQHENIRQINMHQLNT